MDFSKILVISDLDGTLIGDNYEIPQRNREAIARFQCEGGHFTVATGRSFRSGAQYIQSVSPNTPGVIVNGTVLYDFAAQSVLWSAPMQANPAKQYVEKIRAAFPSAGIELFTASEQGVVCTNRYIHEHLEREGIAQNGQNFLDGRPICKALIADDSDVVQKMIAFTQTFEHPEVRFVTSSAYFLEMLPAQADKGSALQKLARMLGFDRENVYAIGDYYNDVELLRAAGFAAMPQNAPEELKALANLVVCGCSDGAVADLIEYIERTVK